MRALYFGTYDRGHPRNVNAIAAMRAAGVEVVERSVALGAGGFRGALQVALAELRLLRGAHGAFDVLIVGYPGHFDVPRARRLARRRPLVFDAVLSLEDELVAVRRRFRPRSPAASVLRAADTRAFRLPDLVVCGSDAEAAHLRSLGSSRVEVVFLGSDEDLFCETWSPTYPFTALHFADGSADVVRAAQGLTDVPVRIAARGDIRRDDHGIAAAHAGTVLGSFRASRAIPPAVFDALATGAPLVTAATPAARELLEDGVSALLVPPDHPQALAAALEQLAADEPLRRSLAAAGRAVFQERASRRVLGERWRRLLAEAG